jgi:hypothetical protein
MSRKTCHYHHYWTGFETQDHTHKIYESIFEDIPSIADKKIHIYSVFNFMKETVYAKGSNELRVSYSGESYNNDPDLYDVNLIMQEDDIKRGIVTMPLFSLTSYESNYWPLYIKSRKYNSKTKFCAFVISNGNCHFRNAFFGLLSQYKRVDSCGRALNNCGFTAPSPEDGYFDFLSNYKFMICFENTSQPAYLTEKLQNAWLGGTIPIYWGAKKSLEWLNPKAFLYLEDTSEESIKKIIEKIIELDNDNDKYIEMFNEPLVLNNKIPDEISISGIREKVIKVLEYKKI